ncbi:MAG: four helix bundle protein [Promethearchaeota archaeon]
MSSIYSIYHIDLMSSVARDRSYGFAMRINNLALKLSNNIAIDSLARQLINSGNSISTNVEEAMAAFWQEDFLHKMGLAKEKAMESKFWLSLIRDSVLLFDPKVQPLIQDACYPEVKRLIWEAEELTKILSSIVRIYEERFFAKANGEKSRNLSGREHERKR